MTLKQVSRTPLACGLVAALLLMAPTASQAGEQTSDSHAAHSAMDRPTMMDQGTMEEGTGTMHQKMQAKMHAWHQRLDALVAEMHATSGSDKTDAVAAVVAELVDQRKAMHAMMLEMQPTMMRHMMEHMRSGMMDGMDQAMAGCPMMLGNPPSEDAGMPGGASAHHPDE